MSSSKNKAALAAPATQQPPTDASTHDEPAHRAFLDRPLDDLLTEQRADIDAVASRAALGNARSATLLAVWRALAEQVLHLVPAPAPIDAADAYEPVGKVRIIAESEHARVIEDDVRRWIEAK